MIAPLSDEDSAALDRLREHLRERFPGGNVYVHLNPCEGEWRCRAHGETPGVSRREGETLVMGDAVGRAPTAGEALCAAAAAMGFAL